MDNEKIIKEVFGGQHPTLTTGIISNPGSHLLNYKDNPNNPAIPTPSNGFLPDRLTRAPFEDKAWQTFITTELIKGNSNLFINIAPSAGKTWPIVQAYRELLKRATPGKIPTILWVAETKLLAAQIERSLQELLYDMIVKKELPGFIIAKYFTHTNPSKIVPADPYNVQLKNDNFEINNIRMIIRHLTGTLMMKGANAYEPVKGRTIAITCTYSFATQAIKDFSPAIVVLDEVQERFKPENTNEDSGSDNVKHFFNNVIAADASHGTSLAILTGSLNPETTSFIIKFLNGYVNHKLQLVNYATRPSNYSGPMITGERNKARITVLPTDLIKKDIPKLIIDQIKGRNANNLIAIFSKVKITEYSKLIITSTPKRDMESVLGRQNKNPNVAFSGHLRPHPLHSTKTISSHARTASIINSPDQLWDLFDNMKDLQLKTAIEHGFGYIMAEEYDDHKNITRPYDRDDIFLVEQLFLKGLIYSILATTSVGVGVNLKVRAIYIPSIDVFNKDFGASIPMSMSSLAQLVHRAGRTSSENAIIYCNRKDVALIDKIMKSGDPSEHIELIPYQNSNNKIGIENRFNYAINAIYRKKLIYNLIRGII